ncbi:MAG: hypothetical protein KBG28_10705 [Kofleriaceae bacterium]|nr:hypothetical protein [Kofleriaceae bacterium]MBP6839022.1 hypothetical protein [Kofleriaceae bacterium]MBP9204426.1 hypothetical protein [Kofleriaceae bacterium]
MPLELAWSIWVVPFAALVLALLALAVVVVVLAGDRLLRLAVVAVVVAALPWAAASLLAALVVDAEVATRVLRVGNGPVSLIGPALLILLLAATGQLAQRRALIALAVAVGTASMALALGTELVVPGVRRVGGGMWYPRPGPWMPGHVGQVVLWAAVGASLGRGALAQARLAEHGPTVRLALALAALGGLDLVVVYDLAPLVPLAWLPALVATVAGLAWLVRAEVRSGSMVDRPAALELGLVALALVLVALLAATVGARLHPLGLAALAAPLPVLAGLVADRAWRRRHGEDAERTSAIEAAVAGAIDVRALEATLAAWLGSHLGASTTRLWRTDGARLVGADGATHPVPLTEVVRSYLVAHPRPITPTELPSLRLGPARAELGALVAALGPQVLIPIVDGVRVLGLVGVARPGRRVLLDQDRAGLRPLAVAVARALDHIALRREAAVATVAERAAELAEVVAAQREAYRRADLGRWRVSAAHRGAEEAGRAQLGGGVWAWDLDGADRLDVLVAELELTGLPGALVASALVGAFAASAGTGRAASDRLEVVTRAAAAVHVAGEGAPVMVVQLDGARGQVRWAGRGAIAAAAMRASGSVDLLTGADGQTGLGAGDWIVVASPGLSEAVDTRGRTWAATWPGLRADALAAREHPAETLMHQALAHAGGAPGADAVVVVVGWSSETRSRSETRS